jgi:hypothetical protein
LFNLIELIVEGEGEHGWADDLCDQDAHEEEQIAIQGSLDGGKLVLGDLGVEADLGLGAGVHADCVHFPGVLEESSGQEEVLIAANVTKTLETSLWSGGNMDRTLQEKSHCIAPVVWSFFIDYCTAIRDT